MAEPQPIIQGFVLRLKVKEFTYNICHLHDQLSELNSSEYDLDDEEITEEKVEALKDKVISEMEKNLALIRECKANQNYYL